MKAKADRHSKSGGQGQGMNWCAPATRLAIYLRDGLACCYCGSGIEEGTKLTLDHLTPHSHGGSNTAENLVTACHKCNSARGNRDYRTFAATVAAYLGHTAEAILSHIETTSQRPLDRAQAKVLLAARGSFSQTLNSLR